MLKRLNVVGDEDGLDWTGVKVRKVSLGRSHHCGKGLMGDVGNLTSHLSTAHPVHY